LSEKDEDKFIEDAVELAEGEPEEKEEVKQGEEVKEEGEAK